MAGGTKLAFTELRHLASYLSGTQEAGVLLMQTKMYQITSDHWDYPEWSNRQDRQTLQSRSVHRRQLGRMQGLKKVDDILHDFHERQSFDFLVQAAKLNSYQVQNQNSELYASCSGIAELLHVGSLLKFLIGEDVQMTAYSDSSAARGIMQRAGQGKLKRIHVRNLSSDPRFGSRENHSPMQGSNSNQPVRSEHEETFTRAKKEADGFDSHRISDWHGDREH